MHDFDRCIGVELLESLYNKSVELKSVYDTAARSEELTGTPKFEVFHDDLLQYDWWTDADIVLANSTCFEYTLMLKIAEKASLMKKGSWMITLTKKLPTADPLHTKMLEEEKREWYCELSVKMIMSWGYATVNLQRKIR
jgi:hypothetical protein